MTLSFLEGFKKIDSWNVILLFIFATLLKTSLKICIFKRCIAIFFCRCKINYEKGWSIPCSLSVYPLTISPPIEIRPTSNIL